jgi:hypothetical protein
MQTTSPLDQRRGAVAPERSIAQRMTALAHANEIRTDRAALKRDLKAGRVSVVSVLTDPPACAETMKVIDLLLALRGVGRVKAQTVLRLCKVSPSKTLGGMTARQRAEVVAMLGRR